MMSENNVLSFNLSQEYLWDKAEDFLNKGDALSCLEFLRRALQVQPNLAIMRRIISVYRELDLYDLAAFTTFKLIRDGYDKEECLQELAHTFFEADDEDLATMYYKQSLEGQEDELDCLELAMQEDLESPDFFPEEQQGHDFEQMLMMAQGLMRTREHEEAIQVLSFIPQVSDLYLEAQAMLAMAYLMKPDFVTSLQVSQHILQIDSKNVSALTTAIMASHALQDYTERQKYVDILLQTNITDGTDLFRAAVTFCELKEHEYVLKFLKSLQVLLPYDIQTLMFAAIAYYNCGYPQQAAENMKTVLRIDENNTVAQYYAYLFENPPETLYELDYLNQVPFDEAVRRMAEIDRLLDIPRKSFSLPEYKQLSRLAMWAFTLSSASVPIIIKIAMRKDLASIAEDALLSPELGAFGKRLILSTMLLHRTKKQIFVVSNGLLRKVNAQYPKGLKEMPHIFAHAYAEVLTSLALTSEGKEKKLSNFCSKLFPSLLEQADKIKSEAAFAASIAYKSQLFCDRTIPQLAAMFDAKITVVRAYNRLIKEATLLP